MTFKPCVDRFVPILSNHIWENGKKMKLEHKNDCKNGILVNPINYCEIILPKNTSYQIYIDIDMRNFSKKPATVVVRLGDTVKNYDFQDYDILFCEKLSIEVSKANAVFSMAINSEDGVVVLGGEVLIRNS